MLNADFLFAKLQRKLRSGNFKIGDGRYELKVINFY